MSLMARAVSKGEQTRTAIIDAALALFEDRGFEATTMRAIADRAGVSVANAYYYFSSKDDPLPGFYPPPPHLHRVESARRLPDPTASSQLLPHHLPPSLPPIPRSPPLLHLPPPSPPTRHSA